MNGRPVSITITAGTVTKTIVIFALFYVLYLVRDLVLVVLTAVVLASATEPMTRWALTHGIRRLLAVILIYAAFAIIFIGIVYFFLPTLLNDLSSYLANLPKYLDYTESWFPLKDSSVIAETSARVQEFSSSGFSLREFVSNASATLTDVSSSFISSIRVVFGGILSFVLIIVLSFYLAVQENGIAQFLRVITPARHEAYVIGLWERSQNKIGLWTQGQLLLAIIVGVLVFLGLSIFKIEQALFLAAIAAVFEIIPIFGPILAAIPAILIALGQDGVALAVVVAGLYLVIQQFENHLIYPLVVKKIVGVSPILVILALVVGGKLAGFLGVILSVPMAAVLMEYVSDIERGKLHHAPPG